MDKQSITNEEAVNQLYQLGGRVLGKDVADVAAQAERVKTIFGKVGKLSGYFKDIVNTLSLLKDYTSGAYTQVPWRIIAALTGAVFYVFNPLDLIPDLVPLFGFADDATVFAAVISFAKIDIASYLAWKADRGEMVDGGGKAGITTISKSEDITNWALTDFVVVVQNALRSIGNDSLFWCCRGAEHISQNATNIIEKIMGGEGNINDVIGVIDMEAFQHCKEGFAFTRDRVYFRQFMGNSFSFTWREIMSIQYEGKELIINGMRQDNMCRDENDAKMICKVLTAIANRADLTPEQEPYDESRYVPISEAIVKRFATVDGGGLLFTGNNIPNKKRMGAHKAMNIQEPPEDICLLFDISPLGSGKAGFALTSQAMYCKDFFTSPARREWGNYRWVANPTSFWLMFVNNQPYYEISGGTLNADQISAIVDALNEFEMYDSKEKNRVVQTKLPPIDQQIAELEKAAEKHVKEVELATVIAQTEKTILNGRKVLKAASVESGHFAVRNGKYYLNEIITIGGEAQLDMKDADLAFGPKGAIVFAGGTGDISNCKFSYAEEDDSGAVADGSFMFRGNNKWVRFGNCDLDGKGHMAGAILDGDITFFRCRIRNLVNKKQGGSVLGTSYLKNPMPRFALKCTSIENCKAASQAILWVMDLNVRDCEFVNCSSPISIITVVEDCKVNIMNSVFDTCSVGAGGAIVSFYSNGGSNQTGGIGIDHCWLKDCTYQYSHNVHIPLSTNNWVSGDFYRSTADGVLLPLFLRDGAPLKKPIGADLNLPDEVESGAEDSTVEYGDIPKGSRKMTKSKKSRVNVVMNTSPEIDEAADDVTPATKRNVNSCTKATRTLKQKSAIVKDSEVRCTESAQQPKNTGKKTTSVKTSSHSKSDAISTPTPAKTKARKSLSAKNSSAKERAEKSTNDALNAHANVDSLDVKVGEDTKVVKDKKATRKKSSKSIKANAATEKKIPIGDAIRKAISESNDSHIYVGEAIPTKKLNNAIACMGVHVGEEVYALIDTTIFGSAKSGLIFTSAGIRWRNDWMQTDTIKTFLSWSEVAVLVFGAVCNNNDLKFSDDTIVSLAGSCVEPETVKNILEQITKTALEN